MENITEHAIERFAIELLEQQGYHSVYAPDIARRTATDRNANPLKTCCC